MLSMQSTKGMISRIRTSVIRVGQLRRNPLLRLSQLSTPTDSFLSVFSSTFDSDSRSSLHPLQGSAILRELPGAGNRDSRQSTPGQARSSNRRSDPWRARSRLAQAYYDLATLLDAGVPILRSLDILIQGQQGHFKRVFSQIRESLSKGSSLSESLDEHRHVFPEMDRMLIEAAETSGSLGDSFKMLSQWHEFVERITRRIQMGLLYPSSFSMRRRCSIPCPP